MRFDARAAKQLKPDTHLTFEAFPGLRLEATVSRRSWIYRFKSPVDGRMRQQKLGEWPAMSYAAAIAAWEDMRARRDAGEDPALTRKASNRTVIATTPESYTVKQLCEDFLTGHIERHRDAYGAAKTRQRMIAKIAPIADLPACAITRRQAFELLEGERQAPRNAAVFRSELGAAWDYALDAGRIPEDTPNWWRQVMRGKLRSVGRSRGGQVENIKRVLSEDELATLIPWLPNLSGTIADILSMYLWTGLRGGEIVLIEGKEVSNEPDGLWWTIPKAKTKNRNRANATDHRVPLAGRADEIIRRRLKLHGKGYLFPTADSPYIPQKSVQAVVWTHQPYSLEPGQTLRPVLPVSHWAPHDLRRTSRTMLAAIGCPHEVAEAVLGHILPGVAGVYNRHSYDKEKREWLTKLADHLESIANRSVNVSP
ncbi:tyrosine-type recombinase/integrase [Paraburkholderia antibiotica]|uniref:Integrase family protein n=1 Tax=Paraburkholderia antibiotica TaxID=2728839 RepID=A0A7Y0FGA4_9BURK|nr:integrase family protein [Paraburkholderia antibiotica]NML34878.1 integrase family protein [Paraburkholderia antibiotica]